MTPIDIQFTRFSAFYSPLISTMSGGFLEREGLQARHSIAEPGVSAIDALLDGSAHVVQSALSQGLTVREKGKTPPAVHFAQINEMDGFFLTGRHADADFSWQKLKGADVIVDHGGQPLAMFRYACHRMGVEYSAINVIDAGNSAEMDAAFRNGRAQYIHQQGPAPQQLEHDGVGQVVASVGKAIGACGFSSLAATREWLATDMARAFMRAYVKTRQYINEASAEDIAAAQAAYFPNITPAVLTETIRYYQQLGCWSPHVEITPSAYEVTLDVFQYVGQITQRFGYDEVCALPPSHA